jgi:hypothetical protein
MTRRNVVIIALASIAALVLGVFLPETATVSRTAYATTQPAANPDDAGILPMVDGKNTPELVPDEAAYGILFRVLHPKDQGDEARSRGYARHIGLTPPACVTCPGTPAAPNTGDARALYDAASKYHSRVIALNLRADLVRADPTLTAEGKLRALRELQAEKDRTTASIKDELFTRLSPISAKIVTTFVNDHMKRRMKIYR